jgi:hypothetical protein
MSEVTSEPVTYLVRLESRRAHSLEEILRFYQYDFEKPEAGGHKAAEVSQPDRAFDQPGLGMEQSGSRPDELVTQRSAPSEITKRAALLERIAALATELCISVDRAEEDIGGSRPAMIILQDIGPLTEQLEKLT